jgi:endonuclease/exonuclease/phosphatase family metal-dependent hydrolase
MGQGLSAVSAVRAPFAARFQHDSVISGCVEADILCLQELLSRDAEEFFDGLHRRFTSRFRDDNRIRFGGRMTMRGSGLGIGARTPFEKATVRTFSGGRVGWDRLARKGALYMQLLLRPGVTIDLMTVHLQAGLGERAVAVRAAQLADMHALVESVGSRDRPFIVCGDFNIDGLAPARAGAEYRNLTAALRGFEDLGAASDLSTFDPHPHGNALARAFEPGGRAQRLDYIFFRPAAGSSQVYCSGLEIFFDKPFAPSPCSDGGAVWASDHCGLTATFAV